MKGNPGNNETGTELKTDEVHDQLKIIKIVELATYVGKIAELQQLDFCS